MTGTELLELMDEAEIWYVRECYRIHELHVSDLVAFINKYFIPRPLFENGTPVKVGDRFAPREGVDNEVNGFYVYDDGSFAINNFQYDQDQRVKRPEEKTEALDADGVPIKAGDKLYFAEGAKTPLKCVGFSNDGLVKITGWESSEGWVPIQIEANELTHKKPDSWEQLEADEEKSGAEYWGCEGEDEHPCFGCEHSFMETGKTCTMNKYIDLYRRAKALAGVDDE